MKKWQIFKKFHGDARVCLIIWNAKDREYLYRAMNNVDFVVRATTTKIVPNAECSSFLEHRDQHLQGKESHRCVYR